MRIESNPSVILKDHSITIDRFGHLGRTKEPHHDMFVSYELDPVDNKITRFFIVMRNQKFAMSMDITQDEIQAILDFIQRKKNEVGTN